MRERTIAQSTRRRVLWLAIASSCVWGAACADSIEPTDAGHDASAPARDASDDDVALAACDHYFDAQHSSPCAVPRRPDAELARIKGRFRDACLNQIAAPGSGMTPAALEACATALEALACQWQYPPLACAFHGALPGGTACNEGMQCQSGVCALTLDPSSPGGPANLPLHCGTCTDARREGQTCGDEGDCVSGFGCVTTMTSAADAAYRCSKITEGGEGASCDELTARCKPGLYCDAGHCTPLHTNEGDPCGALDGPGGCQPPLSCDPSNTCAGPAGEGESCQGVACAEGLACDSAGAQQCRAVTWAEPGEACGPTSYCRVNECPSRFSPLGSDNCPAISADGEACTGFFNCDAFSDCFDGVCTIRDETVCR